ncbi:MAG TPA: RNA polymerase sigma-70 factor [Chitinophagaceae bacterium]|nr:RNA polymerase sigma-70 factor [Chitinophagaceae bacterium]
MLENQQIKRLLKLIARNNDQAAYKELFVLFYYRLKRFGYSILKSHEEAEELVSDVFLLIWERREQLLAIDSPRLYIYTTTKNLALTRISRRKKQVDIAPEDWLVKLNSIYFDPEELIISEETLRQINQAIYDLPPRCRLIFKLIKEDGLQYKEVAELLNLSVKTVEAQMAIALRRIGKCMHLEINTSPTPQKEKKS